MVFHNYDGQRGIPETHPVALAGSEIFHPEVYRFLGLSCRLHDSNGVGEETIVCVSVVVLRVASRQAKLRVL